MTAPRVLVTGATGFIGRHCLPLLADERVEVHGTTRQAPFPGADFVTWHQVDLLDLREVDALMTRVAPTHLLHLAWGVNPGARVDAGDHVDWAVAGIAMMRAFSGAGGRRAVFAGSCAEYDSQRGVCREAEAPACPETLYGAAKRALGLVAESYGRASGTSVAWARIFFVYGPHEPGGRLLPTIACALLSGETAACSQGGQRRDYLYVKDVARALVQLLRRESMTGPVNIGSGEAIAVRDLALRFADKLAAPQLLAFGGRPARTNEPPLVVADVQRLRVELGWSPQYSLDTGLDETAAWWRTTALQATRVDP